MSDHPARLQQTCEEIERARRTHVRTLIAFWGAIAVAVLLLLARTPVWLCIFPAAIAAAGLRRYIATRREWLRLIRLRGFHERAVARAEDRWQGVAFSGCEFGVEDHVYDADLHILGEGSLFELLCTARTGIGRRRLAEYLLDPCTLNESRSRQQSVAELKPCADLRERVALLGKYEFQESTWDVFAAWTALPAETAPAWVRITAFLCSGAVTALVLGLFATGMPPGVLFRWAPLLLSVIWPLAWYFGKRTRRLTEAAKRVGEEIAVAREGIELILAQTPRSGKLREIQTCLAEGHAPSALRRLERLTNGLSDCDKDYFSLAARVLIVRTQLCFAIESWKSRHAEDLDRWLRAWAEFEALAALSGYAGEHPDDPFPLLHDGEPAFQAEGLGHPLMPISLCVRNHIALGAENRFSIVSGSNMAGKSTLMRAIGLNAVLAKAGAPVRAHSLSMTGLEVFASLAIVDSLGEGRSKFQAEMERVRRTLEGARTGPVLFLIDEILSGTNSRDRRIAAEAIARALVESGAIGVLSTHDLALTEIADLEGLAGSNVHMGSRPGGGPMDFDYLLKPGVTRESNALAIAAMAGVPIAAIS